ncbi:MAG: hypothetical protein ACTTJE_05035 [Schwartzia sp. (in: firmicutes)]
MAQPTEFYVIQPAFTGGEISEDVASRVDLDKYQMSLLLAENAIIRPYGAVKKRPGTLFCGTAKYAERPARLVRFDFSAEVGYLLEFGDYYFRVWRDGKYLGVEAATPYPAASLSKLRFIQSVDVMYITSGEYPVKKLLRYSETNWILTDIDWTMPPFLEINEDETAKIQPSARSGNIALTATKPVFTAARVGDWLKMEQRIGSVAVKLDATPSAITQTYEEEAPSTAAGDIVSTEEIHEGDPENPEDGYTRTIYHVIRLNANQPSASIPVGKTWKVISHGTWSGHFSVQVSYDNGKTWTDERKYTSNDDYNPTESGTVDGYCLMRIAAHITGGGASIDLSAYSYTHEGYVKITGVESEMKAYGIVAEGGPLGSTFSTADWYWSAWTKTSGYPTCATFFQDRLCFAGTKAKPQRVWMSKSGDYENFGVEKEDGTVTDSSAVSADLLSLKSYRITHMDAGTDLLLLTDGNSWTISGSETVTPTNITPRTQQNYGVNDVTPIRVGARLVYVQRRGSVVRDMGYSYETDSYGGSDLTLLAKHLVDGYSLSDSAYAQVPDSILYFVRSDGVILTMTYIPEQKVFGWSHIVTDGFVEAVETAAEGDEDAVYIVVRREAGGRPVRYIERFALPSASLSQQDHIFLDAARVFSFAEPCQEVTGLSHLEGKEVLAMGDGYLFEPMTVTAGRIRLPEAARRVTVGLPYKEKLLTPNVEIQGQDGTIQGRLKKVTGCTLRLSKSYGGEIGASARATSEIRYDPDLLETGEDVLFSGDIKATLAIGGFNMEGRVYIDHKTPYPFTLSAIIRSVTMGG